MRVLALASLITPSVCSSPFLSPLPSPSVFSSPGLNPLSAPSGITHSKNSKPTRPAVGHEFRSAGKMQTLLAEARVVTGSETSRCVRTMEAMFVPLLLQSSSVCGCVCVCMCVCVCVCLGCVSLCVVVRAWALVCVHISACICARVCSPGSSDGDTKSTQDLFTFVVPPGAKPGDSLVIRSGLSLSAARARSGLSLSAIRSLSLGCARACSLSTCALPRVRTRVGVWQVTV